jgi:hypothetical protein
MKLFLVSLFAAVCLSAAHAEDIETVTIPLSDMWAYRDHEIQPVTTLDPPTDDYPLTKEILNVLAPEWLKEKPKSAFVVTGSPSEALIKAHDVIVNKKPMQSEFAADESLTLVFMSYSGFHMSLKPVELRKGKNRNEISVNYFVKMSGRADAQEYFALIPLGKLPAGLYRVVIEQVAGTSDTRPKGPEPIIPRAVVSPGFTFSIK